MSDEKHELYIEENPETDQNYLFEKSGQIVSN